ncbi:MAG: DUF3575 domain-containing protein [Bacteroidales bacterium]|nr:DUF3575 domain-containing protein [Bacteroidales bacterium]
MKIKNILIVAALLMSAGVAKAQQHVAIKTNILHDATLSPNIAVEYAFLPKWSFELPFSYNQWPGVKDMIYKHAIFQPAVRYWFCERFNGWFVGIHGIGGMATLSNGPDFSQYYHKFPNLNNYKLEKALVLGGGVSFGYDVSLARHWNLEFELGLGYIYANGDLYEMVDNGAGRKVPQKNALPVVKEAEFDYVGPTKASVAIVYIF